MIMKGFHGTHWSDMPNAEEIRQRISATKKKNPTRYWTGKNHTAETIAKISASKKASPNTVRGEQHHEWKGGITKRQSTIRGSLEYITWRDSVYKRDNYTCQACGDKCKQGDIVAHHVLPFSDYKDLRFEVLNGETLHRSCHLRHHVRERMLQGEPLLTHT